MFGAVTLTKNADINKNGYSGYGIGFDIKGSFSFQSSEYGQNVIVVRVLLLILIIKKDILMLGIGPTQGLEKTLTAEKMYSVNFTEKIKNFV